MNNLEFYKGRKVLVTGHTGFKGTWMCIALLKAGAEVVGYSLEAPTDPSAFSICGMQDRMHSVIGDIRDLAKMASPIVSEGNQTGEGWFLTGEMMELIHDGVPNIVCIQPFACLPNHIVGKGVIKEVRREHPEANIVAIDYDPGASEVNQLNRIKLMLSTAQKNLHKDDKKKS